MNGLTRVFAVGLCIVGGGCATYPKASMQDLPATQSALASLPAATLALQVDTNEPVVLTNGIALPPAVAYEWLAAKYSEEQKDDDAALALLMSALMYVQMPGDTHTPITLSVFGHAKELHSGAALKDSLANMRLPGEGGSVSLVDLLKLMGQAAARPANIKDPVFAKTAKTVFRSRLIPAPGNGRTPALQYKTGDPAFLSALGLAWMQQAEDVRYVERYLASDPCIPVFHDYVRAIASTNAAARAHLLDHPSSAVRANTMIALGLPAAAAETDAVIRAAGAIAAWNENGTNGVRTLVDLLSDERHMVRKMALRGLLMYKVGVTRSELEAAMTTTPEWVAKYVGFMGSSVGGTIRIGSVSSGSATNHYRDESLCVAGFPVLGSVSNMTAVDFRWLIGQLRPDPPISTPFIFSTKNDTADGYRWEILETASSEKVNAELAKVLRLKAPQHQDIVLDALKNATPFARLYLLQAASGVASNPAIRTELWRIADGARPLDEAGFRKALVDKIAEEVRAALLYNQTVNYGGIETGVGKIMDNIHTQSRQQALTALSPCTGELQRVAVLLQESDMARSVCLILLANGRDAIVKYVPSEGSPEYSRANPESRLVMAMLNLWARDEPATRAALAGALTREDDIVFAARIALATKQPAMRQVIVESAKVPPLSLAGHLLRRLSSLRIPENVPSTDRNAMVDGEHRPQP